MKEDGKGMGKGWERDGEKDIKERYRENINLFLHLLYIIAYYIYIYIYTYISIIDHSDGLSLVISTNSIEQVTTLLCNISNVCSNFLSFE